MELRYFNSWVDGFRGRVMDVFKRLGDPASLTPETMESQFLELATALEELEVAQEELTVQVEQLAKARAEVEAERQNYLDLFQAAPDGYVVTNLYGSIREANHAAAQLFNLDADYLLHKPILLYVAEEERDQVRSRINQVVKDQQKQIFDLTLQPREGALVRVVETTLVMGPTRNAEPVTLRWMLHDVTEYRETAAALADREERFRTVFTNVSQGILLLDGDGQVLSANPAAASILGLDGPTPQQCRLTDLVIDPAEQAAMQAAMRSLVENEQPAAQGDYTLRRAVEGSAVCRVSLSRYSANGQRSPALIALIEDITEQQQARKDLVEIQRRLFDSVEKERSNLARELHDGPIQDLYGVTFQLRTLAGEMGGRRAQEDLDRSIEQAQNVISSLRFTCNLLKPPSLAPFGLKTAILSYLERIEDFSPDLTVQTFLEDDQQTLPDRTRLALFRIFQQGIMNVIRHSEATLVQVELRLSDDLVELVVRDDGKGFSVPKNLLDLVREGHFGLANASERAESVGGVLAIESTPGVGTTLCVHTPIGACSPPQPNATA